jgi:hypothetical protein
VLSADVPSVVVGDDEGLVKIICQMANGAAPGPSGWTAEMVRVLTEDADCLTGLAMLIQDITNGALPDSVKPFLLSSILIGIDKNAGASVRPIAFFLLFFFPLPLVKYSIESLLIVVNLLFRRLPSPSFCPSNLVLLYLVDVSLLSITFNMPWSLVIILWPLLLLTLRMLSIVLVVNLCWKHFILIHSFSIFGA